MSFVRANARSRPPNADDLEARLTDEMKAPKPNAQPAIVAEPPGTGPITRLFVIWDEWAELTQQDRSEIILEAYTKAKGKGDALKISVAMGITSAEAAKMGIKAP
jgi:hypothetical protein